jgi:non-specific serine/threonine protein kinase
VFDAEVGQGAALTLDRAVAYALGDGADPGRAATVQAPLTRRERQIAGLVADGLTNREIAERLVIGQRTAESHVEHILTKLGFTSRSQIAPWLVETGAGPPEG